jgi:hypothetical protein
MKNQSNPSSIATSIIIASTLLFSHTLFADATVVYDQISKGKTISNTMQIKAGKIRFAPPHQTKNYSIYDSQTDALIHVDINKKKYLSMDKKSIAKQANIAKQKMDKMRQRMQEKMNDMSPKQKKQVEQMMNNHLAKVDASKNVPKADQRKTTRTETIAGIECTVFETYVKQIKMSEICVADPAKSGLAKDDAKTLLSMQEFMKQMQKVTQEMMGTKSPEITIDGIPLSTKLFSPDGLVKMETYMTRISIKPLDSKLVSIPANFSPMEIPKMPGM